jgi:predicted kinase
MSEDVEPEHGTAAGADRRPTMFVMVGLPASGKTSRARELASAWRALRLTPDEWMIPLFGQEQPEGKRNVLEGRLIWLALSALRIGVDVVLDFGVWGKDERSALRALAASVGATSELVYLPVDEEERWRQIFQPPDAAELETTEIGPPPAGFDSWETWAAQWWPTSLPGSGSRT